MRVLVVEDEVRLAASLSKGLRQAAHAVDVAEGVATALAKVGSESYDAIVLDLILPDGNGLDFADELRAAGNSTPIVILTARDAIADRVAGLDRGADDYLVKPFAFEELLARLRAVSRRGPEIRPSVIEIGDLVINTRSRSARRGERPIELTTTEYALIEYLGRRAGEVCSRAEISSSVWDATSDRISNVIDVYIARLRKKIDGPGEPPMLTTIRGSGYVLAPGRSDS